MPELFFEHQIDFIYFVCGLAFWLVAGTAWPLISAFRLMSWGWLALFGFSYGMAEWLDMLVFSQGDSQLFAYLRASMLCVSYLFLFEFGRRESGAARVWRGSVLAAPLLCLLALWIGQAGPLELSAACRLCLGLPAGMLAGIGLLQGAAGAGRIWITLTGCAMIAFALLGGMVALKPSLLLIKVTSQTDFWEMAGVPVQILRGLCGLLVSLGLWRFYRLAPTPEDGHEDKDTDFVYDLTLTIGLPLILTIGFMGVNWLGQHSAVNEEHKIATRLELAGKSLEAKIETADRLCLFLAESAVAELTTAQEPQRQERINRLLDGAARSLPGSLVYLMNPEGLVFASSDRAEAQSLLGHNFAFRDYFKTAMNNSVGRQVLFGSVTSSPGYYTSLKLSGPDKQILGVAVVKLGLRGLPGYLSRSGPLFLLSPQGLVLASTHQEYEMRPLMRMGREELDELESHGQPPINEEPVFDQSGSARNLVMIGGEEINLRKQPVAFGGLSLVSTSPAQEYRSSRLIGIHATMLSLMLFLALLYIWRRGRVHALALAATQRRYREMFENTRSIQLLVNPQDALIEDANQSASLFYGLPRSDLRGKNVEDFCAGKDFGSGFLSQASQKAGTFAARQLTPQGERDVEVFAGPLRVGERSLVHCIVFDVTERIQAEQELRRREEQYRRMVETANEGIIEMDSAWRIVFINQVMADLLACPLAKALGSSITDYIFEDDMPSHNQMAERREKGVDDVYERRLKRADGGEIWTNISTKAIIGPEGEFLGSFAMFADISKRKQAELELRQNVERVRALFNATSDSVFLLEPDGKILDLNYVAAQRRNLECFSMVGKNVFDFLPREFGLMRKMRIEQVVSSGHDSVYEEERDGRYYMIRLFPIFDSEGKVAQLASFSRDVTERKLAERKLEHKAFHDELTGLYNRAYFMDRLAKSILLSGQDKNRRFAMLFFDLDNFKLVNDSFGHVVGDHLLRYLSSRLKDNMPSNTVLARFGGDEFAVLFEDLIDLAVVLRTGQAVQRAFSNPFKIQNYEIACSASIGVVFGQPDYKLPEQVLRDADIAMYQAKRRGPANTVVYDSGMHDDILERLKLEQDLRRALSRNELYCVYQPIYSMPDLRLAGFEALIRWRHPDKGGIAPYQFIPIAEETGLIVSIGRYILRESCLQMRKWIDDGVIGEEVTMSVNLSAKQFFQSDLAGELNEVLKQTGLPAKALKVEITESILMESMDYAIEILHSLRSWGIKTSLDDFGTGYSSLGYLRQLPLDTIKIDRAFVADLAASAKDTEIVRLIVRMAHTLGMDVVVEGIETVEVLDLLKTCRCDMVQGYLLAKPGTSDETESVLRLS